MSKGKKWLGTVTVVSLSVGLYAGLLTGVAHADYQPSPTDVVGIGGSTPQYELDFGANGDIAGDLGYNAANNVNKLVTFDATGDANGRDAYADGSTLAAPVLLDPTVVLRAGTSPVQRPQSSSNAISALLADTGAVEKVSFAASASEPTAANQTTASHNNWTFLHVVEIGTDPEEIVADSTTNAPAGLSIAELLGIYKGTYTQWNQLPNNSSGSSDTIIPLLPVASSSITKTFLADLKTQNGGTAPTLSAAVKTVEQNDPTAITSLPAAQSVDAIVPFSNGRLNLYGSGYFLNPVTVFPGGSPISAGVKALTATAPDASAGYTDVNTLYVIFRQTDATSTTPWQPGSSQNWVQALFSDPSGPPPFFATPAGKALVAAAGATANYQDLGDVSNG